MNIQVKFADIEERDTDFAIIRSFIDYESVRNLFLTKINKTGSLIKVYHSKVQTESDGHVGESDIIFILEHNKKKFAIFVEDKIAADPQPSQRKRYDDRAELLKKEEKYDEYFVFLCAPEAYLGTAKADGYYLTVSHEEIAKCLNDNDLNKFVFAFSTDEKKQGYNPIKNEPVTEFWDKLYKHVKEHHPQLIINESSKPRGGNAVWPEFGTNVKGLRIIWKTNIEKNCIDLTFNGLASDLNRFNQIVASANATNYVPAKTNKSMALRASLPTSRAVFFKENFEKQIDNIDYCLRIIDDLFEVGNRILRTGTDKI